MFLRRTWGRTPCEWEIVHVNPTTQYDPYYQRPPPSMTEWMTPTMIIATTSKKRIPRSAVSLGILSWPKPKEHDHHWPLWAMNFITTKHQSSTTRHSAAPQILQRKLLAHAIQICTLSKASAHEEGTGTAWRHFFVATCSPFEGEIWEMFILHVLCCDIS